MSSSPQGSSRQLYLRLLGYVRPYWRVFSVSLLTMALAAATEPVLPALMKPLLDGSFVERNQTHPYLVPLAIIGHGRSSNVAWFGVCMLAGWCVLLGRRWDGLIFWIGALLVFAADCHVEHNIVVEQDLACSDVVFDLLGENGRTPLGLDAPVVAVEIPGRPWR